jgi:xanthine dehydrogenase accessory factor
MESAKTFYKKLNEAVQTTPVAIATIIKVRGSVPREVGAKMLIHPLGQHYGTVGGGCGEADVIRAGLNVLESGQSQIVQVDLTQDVSMQSLGVCGGIMDVYVERWP